MIGVDKYMIANFKNVITLNFKQLLGGFIISVVTFIGLLVGFRYNNSDVYYQVIFDSAGGSEVAGQNILIGNKVSIPSTTTKEGYIFKGWYSGNVKFDFSTKVRKDIILKAKWEKIEDIIKNDVINNDINDKVLEDKKIVNDSSNNDINRSVCSVRDTVISVSSVSLNTSNISLKVGDSTVLVVDVQPSNATNKVLSWSSSNEGVATVSGGVVRAISSGSAVITVSVDGKVATCTVNVPNDVTYNVSIVDIPSSAIGQCYVYIVRSDGQKVDGTIQINYINGTSEKVQVSASGVMKVKSTISSVQVISAG